MANIPTDLKYAKTHEWVRLEGDTATIGKAAVMGAFTLYLDFYNMFLFLLRFMGDQRR